MCWRTVCPSINKGKRISFRKYYRTISAHMKVIAVITDPFEVDKILECLKRNNAPPFDKGALKAS